MNKRIVTATLAALFAFSAPAFADPGGPRGPGGPFRMGMFFHGLNLNEQQEDQAIAIRKEVMRETKKIRENARESMDEVAAELKKPKADARVLHQLADQRLDEIRKLVHATIDKLVAFHATLTPEQKSELAERLEKGQRRMKKWDEE